MADDLIDTVEKALDELPDVQTAYETIQREAWVWLRSLLARCREAEDRLGECYRLTGADPDGDESWRLAPHAVEEVRRLREEHDTAQRELSAERIEVAHLRAAFRTMERAANERETELNAVREQRCETCRYQRKDDSCARLEKADYDDAHFRGSRNYHDCDDMGRTCGAWARREP